MASQIKVDQITDSSGTTAPEFPNGINASNMPGRNKIINGDFRINQRAYVSGTNTTGANQYTLDRWRVVTSGQNVTFTDYLNGLQVTAPAGGIEQVIEDLNIAGGTYVLSWEGNAVGSVNGTVVAKGEPFELPAKTHATVKFTGGTVARVQLEKGEVVTPFEERFIGDELELCQRYFTKTNVHWRWDGSVGGIATASVHVDFATTMRAIPTISVISASNINMTQGGFSATPDGFASMVYFNNGGAIEIRELKTIYWASAEL